MKRICGYVATILLISDRMCSGSASMSTRAILGWPLAGSGQPCRKSIIVSHTLAVPDGEAGLQHRSHMARVWSSCVNSSTSADFMRCSPSLHGRFYPLSVASGRAAAGRSVIWLSRSRSFIGVPGPGAGELVQAHLSEPFGAGRIEPGRLFAFDAALDVQLPVVRGHAARPAAAGPCATDIGSTSEAVTSITSSVSLFRYRTERNSGPRTGRSPKPGIRELTAESLAGAVRPWRRIGRS